MKISHTRQRLLSSSIIGGLTFAALAVPALAQTPPPPPSDSSAPTAGAQPNGEEEVVVTGTRIKQPNLTSVSPLTVQTSQDFKLQGTTNVETLINNLPQAQIGADAQTSGVSNGATGTASVDLRGIGVTRTLVLVNGKRLQPGDPLFPAADLNNIPASLVDRVDVVTGGASAVYGSDAVAGVVNFIMKRDFEGVRLDAEYTFSNHTNNNDYMRGLTDDAGLGKAPDGNNTFILGKDVTLTIGTNTADNKGNVTAYLGYRQQKPVLQAQFDVSACTLYGSYTTSPTNIDLRTCAGSSNGLYGRFNLANPQPGSLGSTRFHIDPNGTRTFTTASVPSYNYGALNYFQRPDERYTAGFFAHYKVDESVDIYSDFMFTDDDSVSQIAPSGFFASSTLPSGQINYNINCNNPLMTAAQQVQFCGTANAGTSFQQNANIGFRFDPGAARQSDLRHTNYKIDIGVKGDIGEGWSYDVYGQYGTSIFASTSNDYSKTRLQNALLVTTDANGNPVCISGGACVPVDIFQLGGISGDALNYLTEQTLSKGQTQEEVVSGSVTGDLGSYGIKLPWATNGVSVAFGMEYRYESLQFTADEAGSSGDLSGTGGSSPNVPKSSFDVYEYFGEVRVPIAEDQPFAKLLAIDAAYRYSDYSAAGTTSTYKIDAEWAPIDDIRFRAGYNRAVRAPNILELFNPQQQGLFGGFFPCQGAGGSGATATLAQCQRIAAFQPGFVFPDGTPGGPGLYNQGAECTAGQCSAFFLPNPDLKPESADTYTVGVVLSPTFLRGFTASIDYFSIKIKDYMGATPQGVIGACFTGVQAACDLIHVGEDGGIGGGDGYIINQVENTGGLKTQGIDFTAGYKANFDDYGLEGWGSLSFGFIGTYTDKLEITPFPGAPSYDCAGLYGPICAAPTAEWRHQLRMTYSPADLPLTVSVLWRHIGDSNLESNTDQVILNNGGALFDSADAHIGVYDYFDLAATYTFEDRYTLRVGCNNVFDRDPPTLNTGPIPVSGPPTGNGNTFPGTYDVYGRTLFVGITADF